MRPVVGALPVPFASPCQSWRYQAEENGIIKQDTCRLEGEAHLYPDRGLARQL